MRKSILIQIAFLVVLAGLSVHIFFQGIGVLMVIIGLAYILYHASSIIWVKLFKHTPSL